jgi:hypothetical protein
VEVAADVESAGEGNASAGSGSIFSVRAINDALKDSPGSAEEAGCPTSDNAASATKDEDAGDKATGGSVEKGTSPDLQVAPKPGNEDGSKESKTSATVSMNTLMPPTMTSQGLECSVHLCPKALRRELSRIFPDTEITDDFLAIPTAQHAKMDLVRVGEEVEDEKDALLINVRERPPYSHSLCERQIFDASIFLKFMQFAKPICEELIAEGHWADYIDPCSGLPVRLGGISFPSRAYRFCSTTL